MEGLGYVTITCDPDSSSRITTLYEDADCQIQAMSPIIQPLPRECIFSGGDDFTGDSDANLYKQSSCFIYSPNEEPEAAHTATAHTRATIAGIFVGVLGLFIVLGIIATVVRRQKLGERPLAQCEITFPKPTTLRIQSGVFSGVQMAGYPIQEQRLSLSGRNSLTRNSNSQGGPLASL